MTIFTMFTASITQIIANSSIITAFLVQMILPAGPVLAAPVSTPATFGETILTETQENRLFNPDIPLELPDKIAIATRISAYTSSPDETDDSPCISADNSNICTIKDNVVAVNGLPFGTKIKIPELFGDKTFVVHDRMNRRYSCKLPGPCQMDIYFKTGGKTAAFKFGIRSSAIHIYYPEQKLATK